MLKRPHAFGTWVKMEVGVAKSPRIRVMDGCLWVRARAEAEVGVRVTAKISKGGDVVRGEGVRSEEMRARPCLPVAPVTIMRRGVVDIVIVCV